jgi:hypothetical protein
MAYEQAGWHTCEHEYGDLAMIAGDAFAVGMEAYNLQVANPDEKADVRFNTRLREINEAGGEWDKKATDAMLPMYDGLMAALRFSIENDPTPPEWRVVQVEQSLGEEAGHARPDVVYQLPTRELYVRDYKFKLALDPKYAQSCVDEYLAGGQARHYLYFTHARYFNPLIVVADPKPHFVGLTAVLEWDDVMMTNWYESQRAKWQVMAQQEDGTLPLWMAEEHGDKFGPCEAYEACFIYERDPERMLVGDYIQIERA